MKEMTIEQLVLYMFNTATVPVTKEEYKILGISNFKSKDRRETKKV